jgi:hypothetical protein
MSLSSEPGARNLIVLRRSPDWRSFDLNDSRRFCSSIGRPEDLVIRFAEQWKSSHRLDYRQFRHEVKQIALASIATCRNATLVNLGDIHVATLADNDLLYFTDDDDWVIPDLFAILRAEQIEDGFLWGSLWLGLRRLGESIFVKRDLDARVYTNNYCVAGGFVRRLGLAAVMEHFDAQNAFDANASRVRRLPRYLSCTNKHPCSTLMIEFGAPGLAEVAPLLADLRLDDESAWIAPYLARYSTIVDLAHETTVARSPV